MIDDQGTYIQYNRSFYNGIEEKPSKYKQWK
jgi:hypothetical protein